MNRVKELEEGDGNRDGDGLDDYVYDELAQSRRSSRARNELDDGLIIPWCSGVFGFIIIASGFSMEAKISWAGSSQAF